jgi:hypothetical protein
VSYAQQRLKRGAQPGPPRKRGAAYTRAVAQLRGQVQQGRGCWFAGRPGYQDCPGAIDLGLHHNHRHAFTAHHLDRLMDGGRAVPQGGRLVPAHRCCNARDGLRAQNERRAQHTSMSTTTRTAQARQASTQDERTSRAW